MKFLVDECLSPRLAVLLRGRGHHAVHVCDVELAGCSDDDVMAASAADGYVLLSADTDFGELLARSNDREPSVVLFRGAEVDAEALVGVLLANLDRLEESLRSGAIVVVLDDRIRHLPLDVALGS